MFTAGVSVRSVFLQFPVRGICPTLFKGKSPPPGHSFPAPLSTGIPAACCPTPTWTLSGVMTLSDVRTLLCARVLSKLGVSSRQGTLSGISRFVGLRTVSCFRTMPCRGISSYQRLTSGFRTLPGAIVPSNLRLTSGFGMLSNVRAFSGSSGSAGATDIYSSLSDSAPVHLCEHYLVSMQQGSGLPWWLNIVMSTLVIRTVITLPLATYQMVIIAKVEALQAEIAELAKRLRYEVSVRARERGWTEKQCRFQFKKNLRRIVSQLYIRDNCHPFKASLLVWVQLPLWISLSLALRNISLQQSELTSDLAAGGTLWFPDLTLPDSTWILPVCLGLTNLLILEVFSLQRVDPSRFQRIVTNFIRALSVLMIPIAATVPSSMALYWFTSSLVGFSHNLLLRSPAIHKMLRLQTQRSATPYRDLMSAFITKYFK